MRRLWERLRRYGSKPVTNKIADYLFVSGEFKTVVSGIESSADSAAGASLEIVRSVWKKYSRFTAAELSALTHVPGGPWVDARTRGLPFIPDQSIA